MESRILTCTNKEKPFPKLMRNIHKKFIILARWSNNGDLEGTIIHVPKDYTRFKLGEHSKRWVKENFEDFSGEVLLKD